MNIDARDMFLITISRAEVEAIIYVASGPDCGDDPDAANLGLKLIDQLREMLKN